MLPFHIPSHALSPLLVLLVLLTLLPLPPCLASYADQSKEELQYPKLHKCVDLGEAYSAAYLTTKEHLLKTEIERCVVCSL
jgi:hypothetical protein